MFSMPRNFFSQLTRFATLAVVGFLVLPSWAWGQMFSYDVGGDRPIQSLSVGYTVIDFSFDGDGEPSPSFEFSQPLYSVVYTRPSFIISVGYGTQDPANPSVDDRQVRMLDLGLSTWGRIMLTGRSAGASRVFVPIVLHSNYRRVAPEGEEDSLTDSFNMTVLGLGAGLGYIGNLGGKVTLEARATPIIGLAIRSFGDTRGSSRLFDGDVQLHFGPLLNGFGLSLGYGFRAQAWNISASDLIPNSRNDLFDYKSLQHTFRVGVNW